MRSEPPLDGDRNSDRLGRSRPGEDLVWDAYCYLTDAMPPAEVSRFETQLGHDPATQAALTEAAELVSVGGFVAADCGWSGPARVRVPRRRWMLAAAGLATAAGLFLAVWGTDSVIRSRTVAVALAWVSLRSESGSSESAISPSSDPTISEATNPADPIPGDGDPSEIAEIAAEQPLPSWMLATLPLTNPDPDTSASEGN